jgi:polyferredoxin
MAQTTRKRRSRTPRSQIIRRIVQVAFLVFILVASVRHGLADESLGLASIDAQCPFGGITTLYRVVTEGEFVPKTHPSNIVLGIGFLVGAVLAGGAFCGWICPFGTLQDALTWVRTKLRLPELHIPDRLDRWMRYLRFVSLALVLYMTISTVKLWFASYDPYRTILGLGWLFEFNLAEQWPAYAVAVSVLGLSFFVPRFWCKYTCPFGAAQSLLGHISLLRIKRRAPTCKGCNVCTAACPVGLKVAEAAPRVSTNCIGCLACVEACPVKGTLEVQVAPGWWNGIKSLLKRRPARKVKLA